MRAEPERRQWARFASESEIELESLEYGRAPFATMHNYGRRGLYFESDRRLDPGARLFIGIPASPYSDDGQSHECFHVQVRWCKKTGRTGRTYGYGVEFVGARDLETRRRLRYYSHSIPKPPPRKEIDREKRKHARREYGKPVLIGIKNRFYHGLSGNISRGGIYIETQDGFDVGQEINIAIPGSRLAKETLIKGQIVHNRPSGIGVKFVSLVKRTK
jgi:Tfp pilus assembly protein PilZ